ncbi:MAG: hydroxyacylglutathione hydrolase [Alphaproteobacteria bacterium]|nr:hydroxyacylglutathione hydrolase [Alphaproteobacteria bacterium]MCD8570317.1 hydroxyacylglutathione hydrolase [Alphaproteobacteria bacterium]
MTHIHPIPILNDNYAYVIENTGQAAVIDPGEAPPVLTFLKERGLTLTHILCTHHHGDHIGGVTELKAITHASVIGPAAEQERIPGMDKLVRENDTFTILGQEFKVLETPGHTRGHICFYAPSLKAAFTGDTLFSLGCGRLFEGTAEEMWESLQKITALPDDTLIYCGHEYTESNARFCMSVEPDNQVLAARMTEIKDLRAAGKPTLPVTLSSEKACNVFLHANKSARFAELRALKDSF